MAQAHDGGLGNGVMWAACEGRQINDTCAFQSLDHDVFRGSCQAMSNALVCVRNQPIAHASNWTHRHSDNSELSPTPDAAPVAARRWPWLAGAAVVLVGGLAGALALRLARLKAKRHAAV